MRRFLTKYEIPIYAVILAAALFCFAVGMSGCSAPVRLAKIGAKHPHAAAVFCADRFPSKDSFSVVREYIRGRDSVRVDSVLVDCGEIPKWSNSTTLNTVTRYVKAACPPCITRVDTMKISEYERQLNRAAVQTEKDEAEKQRKEKDEAIKDRVRIQSGRNTWRMIAIASLVLILGSIAWKLFKPRIFGK